MASERTKKKIRDVLKKGYFKDEEDLVDVSDGPDDDIHLVVVSRKFDGRRLKDKHDIIWAELTRLLKPAEWGKITLTVGASPEEIKAS